MSSTIIRSTLVLILVCTAAVPAAAQEDGGARISGFYAGVVGEGATNSAAGGAAGYRFNSRFGFDFEALALPDFGIGEGETTRDGRGVAFLSNFVAEFPSPARWLTPYVKGGGGIANLRYTSDFIYEDRNGQPITVDVRGRRIQGRRVDPRMLGDDVRLVRLDRGGRSSTSLALSVGGGVDFTFWKNLAAGPTITFMKLYGDSSDVELTRIGIRTAYRF